MRARRPDPNGIARWAELTSVCLAMRRAGIRAKHIGASAAQIERLLRASLERARADRDLAYRRNA